LQFFWNLVVHPTATFRQIQDRSAGTVFRWYLVALALYTALTTALAYSGLAVTVSPSWVDLVVGYSPMHPSAYLFPLWLIMITGTYLGSALYQTILSEISLRVVFGSNASRGVGQSFKAIALSHLPWLLVGWIPLVGTIASVPMLLYQVIGMRELHHISTKQAIVAIFLIPALLATAIIALLGSLWILALLSPHP
jgi:hypothetical protein